MPPTEARLIEYVLLSASHDEEHGVMPGEWVEISRVHAASKGAAWALVRDRTCDARGDYPGDVLAQTIAPSDGEIPVRLVPASAWGEAFPVSAEAAVVLKGGPA